MHIYDLFEDNIDFTPRLTKGDAFGQDTDIDDDGYTDMWKQKKKLFPDGVPGSGQEYKQQKGVNRLGKGIAAYAVSKTSKPHDVRRLTFAATSIRRDPYLNFLKMAIQNQDNIHFPKIYSLKIFKRPEKYLIPYFYYVELERLVENSHLNWGQWQFLYNKYLGIKIRDVTRGSFKEPITSKSEAASYFADQVRECIEGINQTTDKDFTEILKKLGKTYISLKEFAIYLDIHSGNIMFRITPTGVIPVITDPFHGYPGVTR